MKTVLGLALLLALACTKAAGGGGEGGPDAGPTKTIRPEQPDAGPPDAGPSACRVELQDCSGGASCLFVDGGVATACVQGVCDLVRQDCAAGQKCSYGTDAGVTARVCMTEGTADEGQPCPTAESPNGCKKGLLCVDPSGDGGSGICQRLCDSDSNCTAPATCEELLSLPGTQETPALCVTLAACDLLTQSCGAGQACYLGHRQPACYPQGKVPVGGACSYSSDCVKGAQCAGNTGQGVCRALCGLGGTPACASGSCTPASSPAPSGVGVCL